MGAPEPRAPIVIRCHWIFRGLALRAIASVPLRLRVGRLLSVVVGVGARVFRRSHVPVQSR